MNARASVALLLFAGCDLLPARQAAPPARPAVARNVWTDEQFEEWVVRPYADAAAARRTLDARLNLFVEDLDRVCRLTEAQKHKLLLAGRGDTKRLFDAVERVRERFRGYDNDLRRLRELTPDVHPIHAALYGGPARGRSLVARAVRSTLTADQAARYDAVTRERLANRHRAHVATVVRTIEQVAPLRDARRRELIALLLKETKPARSTHQQYALYILAAQAARLPEGKLKPFFSDTQWVVARRHLEE